ncbi:nucleoid-associated protein [Chromatiaceae bacterium AAb-1]|nr:nucleoid-associated protein [Chromatiaceae bacterium AAb-1]
MQITEAILHQIKKERSKKDGKVEPRKAVLPLDAVLTSLTESVHSKYSKEYNQHGSFGTNPAVNQFPVILTQYLTKQKDLLTFSKETADLICAEMNKKPLTTSGFVKFMRYVDHGRDWLLVLMLKTKARAGIDETTLALTESYIFDIEHLHEAARIDVQKFLKNETPYLTFVKPRSGKDDPSDFFRDALSCTDYVDSKHNTKVVLDALDSYASAKNWSAEQKQEARQKLYDYCKEKTAKGESVNLTGLSAWVDDQNPTDFREHIKTNDFQVNDSFAPHAATYSRLKRISKKFGHVSLAFDVDDVLSHRIELVDAGNGKYHLQINDVPDVLVQDIKKAKGS